MKAWLAGILTLALAAGAASAQTPPSGSMDATLRSSKGEQVNLSRWRGKPVILFYEDKASVGLNGRLKEELFARGQQRGLLTAAHVVAVANLEAYNFFPAKQIALSHVRDEEKKAGVPILVDLEGTLGASPWGLPKKTSNVLLLNAEGTLIFKHSGRMKEEEMEAFFVTLGQLVGVDMAAEKRP
jgi:hypothetical protein